MWKYGDLRDITSYKNSIGPLYTPFHFAVFTEYQSFPFRVRTSFKRVNNGEFVTEVH